MGEKGNAADVRLTEGFWLGKYVVTQSEYSRVMGERPWSGNEDVQEGASIPATFISYDDAVEFCRNLGRLSGDKRYRLPTEAEWEYACRAGTETKFSFGDKKTQLVDYGWFDDNTEDVGESYAHDVGSKIANPWGFDGMHGNIWEWCSDKYRPQITGGNDPNAKSGRGRVVRGGCWIAGAEGCRSASRACEKPSAKDSLIGFRIARGSAR